MPWDAPEMAVDLSSASAVPLRNVPDVFGMVGRRDSATALQPYLPNVSSHSGEGIC